MHDVDLVATDAGNHEDRDGVRWRAMAHAPDGYCREHTDMAMLRNFLIPQWYGRRCGWTLCCASRGMPGYMMPVCGMLQCLAHHFVVVQSCG